MNILILGNGGAICDDLPYNAFLLGENFLVETPPDIMQSLFREKADLSRIDTIFISHFHADHFFGFPLLALRLFFDCRGASRVLRVIGPEGIAARSRELCETAWGSGHPSLQWLSANAEFSVVKPGVEVEPGAGVSILPFSTRHLIETFGFVLRINGAAVFTYLADTLWDDSLIPFLELGSGTVLADMNGEPSDPRPVHMTESDVITFALPHCPAGTVFLGTHLKTQKESRHPGIRYVRPGDRMEI